MANRDTATYTNTAMLINEMREEIINHNIFGPWIGQVKVEYEFDDGSNRQTKQVMMSGEIVEKMEDWSSHKKGRWGDSLEYPARKRLTGQPFYGDTWIEKTGEDLEYQWQKAFINLMSKTVMQQRGIMDKLRDDDIYDLLNGSREELMVWMYTQLNAQFISGLYDGASVNITTPIPSSPNGIGLKKILPSNVYYNTATGPVTVGTAGKNKTPTELSTAASTYTTHTKLTTTSLIQLKPTLKARKIQPKVRYKGKLLYLIAISEDDLVNLLTEETFRETAQQADMGYGDNARYILPPDIWIWMGYCIVANNQLVRKWSATHGFAGTNGYYTEDPATELNAHNYCVVLGASSLMYAIEADYNWVTNVETFNHKTIKELAIFHVFGVNRIERVDEADIDNYWVKNQSTAAYITSSYNVVNTSVLFLITKPS